MFYEKVTSLLERTAHLPDTPIEEYALVAAVTATTATALDRGSRYETLEPLTSHDNRVLCRVLGAGAVQLYAHAWDGPLYDQAGFRGELLARSPLLASYPLSKDEHRFI